MQRLYLVPIESVAMPSGGTARGPKYFSWRYDPDPPGIAGWAMMDYGFMPSALLLATAISDADDATLRAHPDVYAFPQALAGAIAPADTIDAFCEGIGIPTNWVTPSTTYLALLRCLAGTFQFMQRYGSLSGGQALLGGTVTLATRYRDLSAQQQSWFSQTVASLGYDPAIINANNTLRQMLKLAGDAWGARSFFLGGMEF